MKTNHVIRTLILTAAIIFCAQACASFPQKQQMSSMARVYDRPYDTVYSSVEDLLSRSLKYALKKSDKAGGCIETEWVHRMDTEGKKRLMVLANVRKVQGGTEVVFYKKSDLQDEISKSLDKYKPQKKDSVDTPSAGWKKTDVDLASVDDMYRLLEKKLAAQQ